MQRTTRFRWVIWDLSYPELHYPPNESSDVKYLKFTGGNGGENGEDDEDNDDWHEVGAKNKSLLTRRVGNSNESLRSPVGCIFQVSNHSKTFDIKDILVLF